MDTMLSFDEAARRWAWEQLANREPPEGGDPITLDDIVRVDFWYQPGYHYSAETWDDPACVAFVAYGGRGRIHWPASRRWWPDEIKLERDGELQAAIKRMFEIASDPER